MKTIKKVADTFTGGNVIATSITSSSTNNEVAGAKAVYDLSNELNMIKLNLSTQENFTETQAWRWHIVPLDTAEFNYGSGLSFNSSNHSVVIGANVSLVRISLTCTISQGTPATTRKAVIGAGTSYSVSSTVTLPPAGNVIMVDGQAVTYANTIITPVSQGDEIFIGVQTSDADTYRLIANKCCLVVEVLQKGSTASTNSLNTTRLMNTGELVGMGDRVELTDINSGDKQIISRENTLESENGSGDTI